MANQYDTDDAELLVDGDRIEQLLNFDPPDESYDREYTKTHGDDDNVLGQDRDPDLEGEFEVAPTSGSIPDLDELLREGDQVSITALYPPDDAREDERYVGSVLTERSRDTYEFEGGDVPSVTYSFIADQIE